MDQQQYVNKLLREVEKMKRNFGIRGWKRPTVQDLVEEGHCWEIWFAWRPVKDIHGRWHWLKDIYRILGNTYVDHTDWAWYYYGTAFDLLND